MEFLWECNGMRLLGSQGTRSAKFAEDDDPGADDDDDDDDGDYNLINVVGKVRIPGGPQSLPPPSINRHI
jgi:hypothetical protein